MACRKLPFPSPRQARGRLRPSDYPAWLREQVDYDYLEKLSEEERIWLAAFTEEWVKGWALSGESQVLPREMAKGVWAERQRRKRGLQHEEGERLREYRRELRSEAMRRDEVEEEMVKGIDRRRRGG